ncbi:unnamed protein product [Arctogadus glacialis]
MRKSHYTKQFTVCLVARQYFHQFVINYPITPLQPAAEDPTSETLGPDVVLKNRPSEMMITHPFRITAGGSYLPPQSTKSILDLNQLTTLQFSSQTNLLSGNQTSLLRFIVQSSGYRRIQKAQGGGDMGGEEGEETREEEERERRRGEEE